MATYKVPQDVEADDKLIGPFSLRQFIYLIVVAAGLWLTVVFARNTITMILIPLPLFPALFFGLLVFLGIKNPSQPAELYLSALVRFYFKPHKRIWNQDGASETVRVTAPPKIEHQYSDNLTGSEVRGRLGQLANMMDSRGWAAKNTSVQPSIIMSQQSYSDDRLISIGQMPQVIEPTDVHAQDDIMDETASPVAQAFDSMIAQKQAESKQHAIATMHDPNYNPYPNMRQRVITPISDQPTVPQTTPEQTTYQVPTTTNNQPDTTQPPAQAYQPEPYQTTPPPKPTTATPPPQAILNLAQSGGDNLSIQTLAHEAEKIQKLESGDEISLH